jgi:hypothetical protein
MPVLLACSPLLSLYFRPCENSFFKLCQSIVHPIIHKGILKLECFTMTSDSNPPSFFRAVNVRPRSADDYVVGCDSHVHRGVCMCDHVSMYIRKPVVSETFAEKSEKKVVARTIEECLQISSRSQIIIKRNIFRPTI